MRKTASVLLLAVLTVGAGHALGQYGLIMASSLDREFDANPISAAKKYEGKTVLIGGTIMQIDSFLGRGSITFKGSTLLGVSAHFRKADDLINLRKGQDAKVRCKTVKAGIIGGVTLSDCTLLSSE